jgi:hypothetical protein
MQKCNSLNSYTRGKIMKDNLNQLRARILLSLQRALLGEVTSNMRAISVEWSTDRIKIWVYYDGPVDEDIVDDFDASAVTQVVADFPYPDKGDPKIDFEFLRCDIPQKIGNRGEFVFYRNEGNMNGV